MRIAAVIGQEWMMLALASAAFVFWIWLLTHPEHLLATLVDNVLFEIPNLRFPTSWRRFTDIGSYDGARISSAGYEDIMHGLVVSAPEL